MASDADFESIEKRAPMVESAGTCRGFGKYAGLQSAAAGSTCQHVVELSIMLTFYSALKDQQLRDPLLLFKRLGSTAQHHPPGAFRGIS